ncbi:MAG TPA: hypothetical protein VMT34_01465, partial [Aggregatilineales bacterium]|nr:hypothetical protein [Aggregatilineales bacterium]
MRIHRDRVALSRWGLLAILLLLIITAAFRLENLVSLPPGMHNDVAQNMADALRISRSGTFPLSLDSRPEPLWRFCLAVIVWWTGAVPFAEKFMGLLVGLLTVAVAYRAMCELLRLWRWTTPLASQVGGLLAASAIASNVALEILNRQSFRAGTMPLLIGLMVLFWARAWRLRRPRSYIWAGISAGFPMLIYTAGLVMPLVVVGVLAYLLILGRRGQRPAPRALGILVLATGLSILPQVYLAWRVPDLYGHIRQMQSYDDRPDRPLDPLIPPLPDLIARLDKSVRTFYATGYYVLDYNTPDTPFLNPAFALLALLGCLVAVLNFRTLPAVLPVALVVIMIPPAALSMDPDDTVRLSGAFLPLAALAGIGACGLAVVIQKLTERRLAWLGHWGIAAGATACLLISAVMAHNAFESFWIRPEFWKDPEYWLSFPHYFSINFTDLLTMLKGIDHPVYLPMPQVDSATATWYLGAQAFTKVSGLKTATVEDVGAALQNLPDAELWYPYAAEFNVKLPTPAEQFALLVPGSNGRDGTISLLPPISAGQAAALRARAEAQGQPIHDPRYGWRLGWSLPVKAADLSAAPVLSEWHPVNATFGGAVKLLGYEAPPTLVPGTATRVTLYWKVLAPVG